ncbi:unnamed protein product [Adineta ricciae]|uniref:Uncharacterized protein n=1 Tax=Adineta ricciae TaxID=249248 RepID=A0A815EB66_ADIRI|nr:unnamed protein product [Adineta ricciae]
MPTVDFAACLANYWFIWTLNGLGVVFSLGISLVVAYFFLKYFQFLAHGGPEPPKKGKSPFDAYQPAQQNLGMPVGAWSDASNMGNVFNGAMRS